MTIREIQPHLPLPATVGGTGLVSPTGLLIGGATGSPQMATVNPLVQGEVPTWNGSAWSNKLWGDIINVTNGGYVASATSPGGVGVNGTVTASFSVLDANSTILVYYCGVGENVNNGNVRLFAQIDSGTITCFAAAAGNLLNATNTSALFSYQYMHNAGQLSVGSHQAKLLFHPTAGSTTTLQYPSTLILEVAGAY